MNPYCISCSKEMICSKNGSVLVVPVGIRPYKIYQSDCYKCPNCGFEVMTGFAQKPTDVYHELSREAHEKISETYKTIGRYCAVENYRDTKEYLEKLEKEIRQGDKTL